MTFFRCRLDASAGFEGVPFATALAIFIYGMMAGAPSRRRYLHSSTEIVFTYEQPMIRQYGFVSPPTMTT